LTCKRDAARRARQDPEKRGRILAYWRAYRARKQDDPAWRERRNESAQAARARRIYGITRADYEALLMAQGGVCGICHGPSRYRRMDGTLSGRFAIDHDHKTGRVRGLLCDQCNRLIGHLEKDPIRALGALAYLDV
jgi:hypothetical protein